MMQQSDLTRKSVKQDFFDCLCVLWVSFQVFLLFQELFRWKDRRQTIFEVLQTQNIKYYQNKAPDIETFLLSILQIFEFDVRSSQSFLSHLAKVFPFHFLSIKWASKCGKIFVFFSYFSLESYLDVAYIQYLI